MSGDKKVVNLGCGQKLIPDAINIDRIPFPGIDYVVDFVKEALPEQCNNADEVIADYVLCQVFDKEDFKNLMNRVWQILKPGGEFHIKVPNAKYSCAFNDPMDCRYFTRKTFDYFDKDHYRFQKFNYGFMPWEIISIKKERRDRLYATLRKPQ